LALSNSKLAKHIVAAATEFAALNEKHGGFSFWNGPRFFVANEIVHNPDGLHFAWPTLLNVDMVSLFWNKSFY
jgi:hypothetical protein